MIPPCHHAVPHVRFGRACSYAAHDCGQTCRTNRSSLSFEDLCQGHGSGSNSFNCIARLARSMHVEFEFAARPCTRQESVPASNVQLRQKKRVSTRCLEPFCDNRQRGLGNTCSIWHQVMMLIRQGCRRTSGALLELLLATSAILVSALRAGSVCARDRAVG